ncbi:Peroxisomal membrane protein PMP27 [Rhizina undulata]
MVADSLVYHPTVSHYLRFISTTVGRDKALRLVQYISRFLAFYLHRKGYNASTLAPVESLKKQFASARKIMRLGKNIEHFKAAAQELGFGLGLWTKDQCIQAKDNKSLDPVLRYCAVGRQLGYAGYLTFDAMSWLDATGLWKGKSGKKLQEQAYKAWMFGIIFSLVGGVYTLYSLTEKEKAVKKTEAEGKVEGERIVRERKATQIQLLSDVCDVCIPTSALGYVKLDDGLVGIAGSISSYIGLKAAWKKTSA